MENPKTATRDTNGCEDFEVHAALESHQTMEASESLRPCLEVPILRLIVIIWGSQKVLMLLNGTRHCKHQRSCSCAPQRYNLIPKANKFVMDGSDFSKDGALCLCLKGWNSGYEAFNWTRPQQCPASHEAAGVTSRKTNNGQNHGESDGGRIH